MTERRSGRSGFFEHLHPATIPAREARFTYTFGLGGISAFLFLMLLISGALLMFAYVPTVEGAPASVRAIAYLAPYGWLVRNLHYWAAQLLVVCAGLHLLRVVLSGAYKRPRRFNWLLGLGLFVALLLLNFTGYVLRWDVDTNWALTVGTGLVRETPLLGAWLYRLLLGGMQVGEATVVRFYAWHTLGLSLPAAFLVGWHAFRVRRDGGISWRAAQSGPERPPRIRRSELVRREGLAMLGALAALMLLSLLFNAPLGAAADGMSGVEAARAPWFFLWVQALLRWLSPLLAGVLIPLLALALLALLPWALDRSACGVAVWFNRDGRLAQAALLLMLGAFVFLTLWEALR